MSAELAVIESDVQALDTLDPASREVAITGILQQCHDWLTRATAATGPADIANFKAYVASVAETTKQLRVSKEIQQDAEVMVRRSERALGVAIREGQVRGEIETRESAAAKIAEKREARRRGDNDYANSIFVTSPSVFLSRGAATVETYAMADDVTDEQFEEVLTAARDEGNVSRANVVRKIKGEPTSEVKQRKTSPILSRSIDGLSGYRMALEGVTAIGADATPDQIKAWTKEINKTIHELNRVRNLLKEAAK